MEMLRERFDVESVDSRSGGATLLARLPGSAAIVADSAIRIDGRVLDAAGASLAIVANFGVGYDHIDLEAARWRGVRVTNTPGVLTETTAELALALMLAAGRRIAELDGIVRRGEWPDHAKETMFGRTLEGSTVGLIGFGRIGRRVARLLRAFDARVLFCDIVTAAPEEGAEPRELPELLAESDFVSLHVPLTPETRHMIDAEALAMMKRGAVLVNASRGAVVDTAALIEALRAGRIAAAGLDVYEGEPHVPAELRELRNTVLLPHIGSATAATRNAMARLAAENVIAVLEGREPLTPVL